jgi:uncharacterized protein (DUF433 family)
MPDETKPESSNSGEAKMKDQELLKRITLNPKVRAGKPIIQGTRLTVEYILNLLAHGATTEEILAEYQGLKPEDIQACFYLLQSRSARQILCPGHWKLPR